MALAEYPTPSWQGCVAGLALVLSGWATRRTTRTPLALRRGLQGTAIVRGRATRVPSTEKAASGLAREHSESVARGDDLPRPIGRAIRGGGRLSKLGRAPSRRPILRHNPRPPFDGWPPLSSLRQWLVINWGPLGPCLLHLPASGVDCPRQNAVRLAAM